MTERHGETQQPIDWVTFDCYGTLIDWDAGIGGFLYSYALAFGEEAPPPGSVLRTEWESIQFELVQQPYRPYSEILFDSLEHFCRNRGYPYTPANGRALVDSMRSWQPFHDTKPTLKRLRESGLRTAIISNTDHAIIAHSLNQMRIEFDEVITAEDCQAYKPSDSVFEQALERLQTTPDRILHTAFGFKYDIGPAKKIGCQTAWINRNGEPRPGDIEPDHDWPTLWDLADFLADEEPPAEVDQSISTTEP